MLDHVNEHLVEGADDLSFEQMIKMQVMFQTYFADNAVSFTINVKPEVSKDEVSRVLQKYLPFLKGTTIFPEKSRPQSPYERIDKQTYQMVDFSKQQQANGELECSIAGCPIK
jgi:ribonucleotide reductase alpha subunit